MAISPDCARLGRIMDMIVIWILLAAVLIAVVGLGAVQWAALRRQTAGAAQDDQLAETGARLSAAQAELAGRLSQMAEQTAAQQAELRKAMDERLADLGKRVGDSLREQTERSQTTLNGLKERLAVIDAAQKNISELSGQVVGLQEILSNKQARGALGEVQLQDLVRGLLPPNAYKFQAAIGDGRRVDCLLDLPNPPGPIGIDAKFPLESYRALLAAEDDAARTAAMRGFAAAIDKHVKDIAERYIVPGETAESALMFLPAEAVYAELHANFPEVVERSHQARVWIVSPTTLMATLTTIRAVLRDARMREQADLIQAEVQRMLEDVGRLDDRVDNLQRHFTQASEDIRQIRISTDKVTRRAEQIEEVQLGGPTDDALGAAEPPRPRAVEGG